MGMWKNLKKSFDGVKEDAWMVNRILRIRFIESSMTGAQEKAYERLMDQMHFDVSPVGQPPKPQTITVPADMKEKDARIALKRMKLECDPAQDFVVTWEKRGGAQTVMREKPRP